jgi:L-fuculose-phosphate aldolase
MKRVICARDVEELLRRGGDPATLVADGALLTPSARDLLRERSLAGPAPAAPVARNGDGARAPAPAPNPAAPPPAANRNAAVPAASESGPELPRVAERETERFFRSVELEALKREICDVGRRLWQRAYVDGNGGNISVRVAEDLVLCSPTLVSKGFMKPEDLCLVDLKGNQKAGTRRRTSELLMHLAIYAAQPRARACVHAHPPYATGFAVAGVQPPNAMVPEMEVFCGIVPIAPYMTPGSQAMGDAVAALADHHNTILMANHGVVAWGFGVEDAYFKMEIVEAYCRTVLVTAQLGKDPNYIPPAQVKELLHIKKNLGIPDPRHGLKECELRDGAEWRPGVTCVAVREPGGPAADPDAEALVKQVTEEILRALGGGTR